MKLTAVIVDDEVYARNILAHYLKEIPGVDLIGQYDNCITCFDHHDFDQVDLLLLDINLPTVSGIQFSRTLAKYKTAVILTTAYSEYALEGYELNVVDYLLKPIEFERFKTALQKAQERILCKRVLQESLADHRTAVSRPEKTFIFIKADYKIQKIRLEDITYIEGMHEYVRIHLLGQKPVITLQSLKNLIAALPESHFLRIHRSYIINLDQLAYIQQRNIVIGGKELKVGKNYWDEFSAYLDQHSIV